MASYTTATHGECMLKKQRAHIDFKTQWRTSVNNEPPPPLIPHLLLPLSSSPLSPVILPPPARSFYSSSSFSSPLLRSVSSFRAPQSLSNRPQLSDIFRCLGTLRGREKKRVYSCLLVQQNVFLCWSCYLFLLFFTYMLLTHFLLIFYLLGISLPFKVLFEMLHYAHVTRRAFQMFRCSISPRLFALRHPSICPPSYLLFLSITSLAFFVFY